MFGSVQLSAFHSRPVRYPHRFNRPDDGGSDADKVDHTATAMARGQAWPQNGNPASDRLDRRMRLRDASRAASATRTIDQ